MNKNGMMKALHDFKKAFIKHSPEILTAVGIAGMITSTILAVRATPKAISLIEERKNELETEKLSGVELVKTTWTCYIPAAATTAASAMCLVAASSTSLKRNAALATAYTLSEKALSEYKNAVIETVGEKKERDIRTKMSEKQLEQNPLNPNEVIYVTGKGHTRCLDSMFKQRFESDIDTIKRAAIAFNERMIKDPFGDGLTLNDFYYELGLEPLPIGENLGWKLDDGTLDIYFDAQIDSDGQPCIVLNYARPPKDLD